MWPVVATVLLSLVPVPVPSPLPAAQGEGAGNNLRLLHCTLHLLSQGGHREIETWLGTGVVFIPPGQGLGREEEGIAEPIKVGIKRDHGGVSWDKE